MKFRRIERPTLIEFDHGVDSDDDLGRFRTTITFDEQGVPAENSIRAGMRGGIG
jgi:hypothetical protein